MIEVSDYSDSLVVKVFKDCLSVSDDEELTSYVTQWFDLERDLSEFYRLLEKTPETRHFSQEYHGLRLMGIVDLFEVLCWCAIGQQINLTFAHKIKTRLVHTLGDSVNHDQNTYYCFPEPEKIISADSSMLAEMQLSKQKISYLKNISEAFVSGALDKQKLLNQSSEQQLLQMQTIKGIGQWTSNYAAMKCLRNMNCIAYGDTGLSAALHKYFSTEKKPNIVTIDEIFRPFEGWKSYFNFYLWKSLG